MIGDLILWLRKAIRQTFCVHTYNARANVAFSWLECPTCKRSKDWSRM
jgi:hypothetical protein